MLSGSVLCCKLGVSQLWFDAVLSALEKGAPQAANKPCKPDICKHNCSESLSPSASPVESTDLPRLRLHEPLLNLGAMLVGVAAKLNSSTVTVAEGQIHHTPAVTTIPHLGGPAGTPLQQKHQQHGRQLDIAALLHSHISVVERAAAVTVIAAALGQLNRC